MYTFLLLIAASLCGGFAGLAVSLILICGGVEHRDE